MQEVNSFAQIADHASSWILYCRHSTLYTLDLYDLALEFLYCIPMYSTTLANNFWAKRRLTWVHGMLVQLNNIQAKFGGRGQRAKFMDTVGSIKSRSEGKVHGHSGID